MNKFELHSFANPKLPFLLGTHYNFPETPFGANWHKNIEIIRVIEGSGYLYCNGKKTELEKDCIIIVNANDTHRIEGSSPYIKYNWLIVGDEFFKENGIAIDLYLFRGIINNKILYQLYEDAFNILFRILEDKSYNASELDIPRARLAALSLVSYITVNYSSKREQAAKNMLPPVQKGILYLNENFREHLTIEDIANYVGLGQYHFMREFKKHTDSTVINYINSLRCDYAQSLLLHSDYKVKDVCKLCGFENQSYFSKVFKSFIGSYPSELRAQRTSDKK